MATAYRISEDDYVNAVKLFSRMPPRAVIILAAVLAVLAALAVIGTPLLGKIALGGIIGGSLAIVLVRFVLNPFMARRHYRNYKAIQEPVFIGLLDGGVEYSSADASGVVKWEKVHKWRQNDNYVLIYLMPRLYYIVPKSIGEHGFDLAGLISALKDNVGRAS